MDTFEEFDEALKLIHDDNGAAYTIIDGFIYTLSFRKRCILLAVNLPQVNANERRMIAAFLRENSSGYIKDIRFVKEGVLIKYAIALFGEPEYLKHLTEKLSAFLHSVTVEFLNPELNIRHCRRDMYIFDSVAHSVNPADSVEETPDTTPPLPENGFLRFIMDNKIVVFAFFGLLFIAVSLIYIKVASSVGYALGVAATSLYLRAGDKKTFIKAFGFSAATLFASALALYIGMFLAQTELYTFYEFTVQSLNIEYCGFNAVVGSLLALLAVYSTVPAKKKKKKNSAEHLDF